MNNFLSSKSMGDVIVDEQGQTYMTFNDLFNYVKKSSDLGNDFVRAKFISDCGTSSSYQLDHHYRYPHHTSLPDNHVFQHLKHNGN